MDLEERNSGFPSGKLESWKNSDSRLLLWEVSQSIVFGWIKPYMHHFMFALYVLRVWENPVLDHFSPIKGGSPRGVLVFILGLEKISTP